MERAADDFDEIRRRMGEIRPNRGVDIPLIHGLTAQFSVAALVTFPNGPGQSTDNLTGLANNTARGLGPVGTTLTQYYDDNIAPLKFMTGASVSGTSTVSLYLVLSEDGSNWANGINPAATSDQSAFLAGTSPLQVVNVTTTSTEYYFKEFSPALVLRFMPTYWAIVIYNQSGAALNGTASNFAAQHSLISYA